MQFKVGERVLASWEDEAWCPATVSGIAADSVTVVWDEDSSESRLSRHDVKPYGPTAAIPRSERFLGTWTPGDAAKGVCITLTDAGLCCGTRAGVGVPYERGDWLEAELWKGQGDSWAFSTIVRFRLQEPGVLVSNHWVPEAEGATPRQGRWIPAFASSGGQTEPVCGHWDETLTMLRVPGSDGPERMN